MTKKKGTSDSEAGRGVHSHEGRLHETLDNAHKWLGKTRFKGSTKLAGRIRLLVMMGNDYLSGRYTRIPAVTIWVIILALLYVTGPFDLIPDFIPGFGWLDDAFVVGLVFSAINHDLKKYCKAIDLDPKQFGL